jgi:hypothetical protein
MRLGFDKLEQLDIAPCSPYCVETGQERKYIVAIPGRLMRRRNSSKRSTASAAVALAIIVSALILCAMSSADAKDQTTGLPITDWQRIRDQERAWTVDQLSADMLADLMQQGSRRDAYPDILYYIQVRTNLMFDFAIRHGLSAFAGKLVELYLLPLSFLNSKQDYLFYEGKDVSKRLPAEAHLWLRPTGEEHILSSSQFLYVIAHLTRSIHRGTTRVEC